MGKGYFVRCLDNFSTSYRHNIEGFLEHECYELIEGDIRDLETCKQAVRGMDYVLHQAALGSVPRSVNDPITSNEVNVSGFLNMLVATRDAGVKRMVYAANLLEEEAYITVYDPKVSAEQIYADLDYLGTRSPEENRRLVKVVNEPYQACNQAHAIAILTEWDEFKTYDWQRIYDNMLKPAFVFDGRNILDKSVLENIGLVYQGIGK